jgi:hypothetical protein
VNFDSCFGVTPKVVVACRDAGSRASLKRTISAFTRVFDAQWGDMRLDPAYLSLIQATLALL